MNITLNHVTKSYGKTPVLADISLVLDNQAPYALIGPSGIGKTTLFRLIAGLEKPTSGTIGTENALVSYAFQEPRLFPQLTVWENISALSPEQNINEILTLLDLADAAAKYPHELSGGMKKRVGLARALSKNADIYLLDEPTGGQDGVHADAIADAVRTYTGGAIVIIATHDEVLHEHLCPRTITIQNRNCFLTDT